MQTMVLLFFFTLLSAGKVEAADRSMNNTTKLSVHLGYYGDFITHPGFVAGVELPLWRKAGHRFLLKGELGMRFHPRNNNAVFLLAEFGYRWQSQPGFLLDVFLGAGYLHAFLAGELVNATDFGRPYLMPSLTLGTGWNFSGLNVPQLSFFVRLQLFAQLPYNTYVLPGTALLAGFRWELGGGK